MKNTTAAMALLLLSSPAFATTGVQLDCTSYSKAYELKITVARSYAIVNVTKSSEQGSYALPEGKIDLHRGMKLSDGWVAYEGKSSRGNHVTFQTKTADLSRPGRFTAYLSVSPYWTDTVEESNRLDCARN